MTVYNRIMFPVTPAERYQAFRSNPPRTLAILPPPWENKAEWGCDLDEGQNRDSGWAFRK